MKSSLCREGISQALTFCITILLVLGGGSQPPGLFFRKALLNGRHRLSLMGDEYITFPSLRGLTNICLLCM